jgi:hypothetical protein
MSKTTTVTEFNRHLLRQINEEAKELLRPLAEKYGLVLDDKRCSYTKEAMPIMVQFIVRKEDADGNALNARASDFQTLAQYYGLAATDLHREFVCQGKTFRITGINRKVHRTPIIAEDVRTGKSYRFDNNTVKALLGTKAA